MPLNLPTRQGLFCTKGNRLSMLLSQLLLNARVQAIIGPESSRQTNFVISLGDKAQVPIISYSATSPTLTSIRSEYFFRATLNDSSQVKAISAIIKTFGRREVVPIYVDSELQPSLKLVQALLATSFKGLLGDFSLLNGELQPSTFQIVNVFGNGEILVGYWTPQNGLQRNFNSTKKSKYPTPNVVGLRSIIWPGDTTSAPKGWQIPTSEQKRLKIIVPGNTAFSEFLIVTQYPRTKKTTINGGYCIDVFEAVIKVLPYDVPYDLHPYATSNGEAAGKSGVSMIVPIIDNNSKNAWVFLKPLTWDLWITSACSFVFIGFVVGSLSIGLMKTFVALAITKLAQSFGERLVSNLARLVVIIWCFVVLIVVQSYTASLTSLLTVQQLQPTVTDVNFLLNNGTMLAIKQILREMGFRDENLKTYNSAEELNQLFRNGSRNNGISAAFNEQPYMKVFHATYCSKYISMDPTFKADGFAFVLPKGSPLSHDVSRAILNVTEGDQMKVIERKWFKKQASCADPNSLISSNSLSLESFWGLFLISVGVSIVALLIFAAMLLSGELEDISVQLNQLGPEASLWSRIRVILGKYDEWDS
ncbi:hypothetical protein DVH24_020355 [Malus domestica]|uniref:Ionotropic glutamate receptor C-terminal domain-containing protein n=1 Tax=Malus domestica TaxID=3750 RepID=A0A498JC25_MALDO|nr:hypothetical protein DVH24_020355 [Malus domestica]